MERVTPPSCKSKAQQAGELGGGEAEIIYLFESKVYLLSKLHEDMVSEARRERNFLMRSVRPFTQRFCKIIREWHGLSRETLCECLNSHPAVLNLRELPGAYRFFPITPEFIADLEANINRINEYNPYGGGLLGVGAYGVPTLDLAQAIAEICESSRDFRRFEKWHANFLYADLYEEGKWHP